MKRSDDSSVLGIVGKRYTTLQNIEAFKFFDKLIEDGIAEYHLAGCTLGGRRVWVLAKLQNDIEVADGDQVQRYVLLSSSHDGSGCVVACVTPMRAICSNMLSAIFHDAKRMGEHVAIRHTKTIADRVEQATKTLKTVDEAYMKLGEVWKRMAEVQLPPVAIENYFKEVIPDNPKVENPYKTQLVRAQMHQYLKSGRGSNLGPQDTLWAVYNSVTEFMTHEVSERKGSSFDKHAESLWFGQRSQKNDAAMQVALRMLDV
jgi:phage/plasmid-like protein (TIGR03299 family)